MTEKTTKFGKDLPKRLLKYFFGLFIMTAGISLSVISDLGVSPLSTIPYAVTLYCGFDMGLGTTIMHAFFVLIQENEPENWGVGGKTLPKFMAEKK